MLVVYTKIASVLEKVQHSTQAAKIFKMIFTNIVQRLILCTYLPSTRVQP